MKYFIIVDVDKGPLGHRFTTRTDAKRYLSDMVDGDSEALLYYDIEEREGEPEWVTVRREPTFDDCILDSEEAEEIISNAVASCSPWRIDTDGKPLYFDTKEEADSHALFMYRTGQSFRIQVVENK